MTFVISSVSLFLSLILVFYIEHTNALSGHRAWRKLLCCVHWAWLHRFPIFFSLMIWRWFKINTHNKKMITGSNSTIANEFYYDEINNFFQNIQYMRELMVVASGLLTCIANIYLIKDFFFKTQTQTFTHEETLTPKTKFHKT